MTHESRSLGAWEDLADLLGSADRRVRLASPFITYPVAERLADIAVNSPARWSLLTALTPASVANGFVSTAGLKLLMQTGVTVRSTPRLHAKAYLADGRGLMGSANLTRTGLGLVEHANLELLVSLPSDDVASVDALLKQWWRGSDVVGPAELAAAKRAARRLPVTSVPPVIEAPEMKNAEGLAALLAQARQVGLWVKAVYGDDESGGWGDGSLIASSKKGRPHFKPGDLALIYLRDHGVCNAVVEITSDPRWAPEELPETEYTPEDAARWPWINDVRGRMWVPADLGASPEDFGVNRYGLQNGHVRIDLAEFAAAARVLAAGDI